jgi:hypothetical protein
LQLGTSFGVVGSWVGMPSSLLQTWVIPPHGRGQAEQRQPRESDGSKAAEGDVQNVFRWILEAPEELVPGTWRLELRVDGRDLGSVKFEVRPPAGKG